MGTNNKRAKEKENMLSLFSNHEKVELYMLIMKRQIKNCILGALLSPLLFLVGCNKPNQPSPGVVPPNPNVTDKEVTLVIENVTVGGRPATAEERKAIANYNGNPKDKSLIQVQWESQIKGVPMKVKFYAKPGVYLKDYGYRFTKKQPYTRVRMDVDTYKSQELIVPLKNPAGRITQEIPTRDAVENVVYVTIDYRNLNELDDFLKLNLAQAQYKSNQKPFSSGTELYDKAIAVLRVVANMVTKQTGLTIRISVSEYHDYETTIPHDEIIQSITLLEELKKLTQCANLEQKSLRDPYKGLAESSQLYADYEKARYLYFTKSGYGPRAYYDVGLALEKCFKRLESLSGRTPTGILRAIGSGGADIDYSRLNRVAPFSDEDCNALDTLVQQALYVLRDQSEAWKIAAEYYWKVGSYNK